MDDRVPERVPGADNPAAGNRSEYLAGGMNGGPVEVIGGDTQSVPVIFTSPHSGRNYPPEFVAASRLDPLTLRRSEDSFVDEIYARAPQLGAPLIKAQFPRAYVDPNREAYELDPAMFEDPLPDYVNTNSARVAAGLGTVAKVVTNGEEIYAGPLKFAEARRRIEKYYIPYHDALKRLIARTRRRFGVCLVIDCHSMPSVGGPMEFDSGRRRVDIVLGDAHGTSCAEAVTGLVEDQLAKIGFTVDRNDPYSGGYTTRTYGRPETGIHVLQIEINRGAYMDETTMVRSARFPGLIEKINTLIVRLAALEPGILAAK